VKLYGVTELARAAGCKPRTLAAYLARGKCPPADVRLECGPVWFEETVRPWLEARDARLLANLEAAESAIGQVASAIRSDGAYALVSGKDQRRRNRYEPHLYRKHHSVGGDIHVDPDSIEGRRLEKPIQATSRAREEVKAAERLLRGRPQEHDDALVLTVVNVATAREQLARADRAHELREARQANRAGNQDGIPW
jgi:hypothetical protein